MMLAGLAETIRQSRGFAHKRDLEDVAGLLTNPVYGEVRYGDDCAVIADGEGYLLFAIEGFLNDFVEQDPWFAGYCAVMVNASDIYSMGGRPVAVVDALWSDGIAAAAPVLKGLVEAAGRYNIPLVGGHTNCRSPQGQLAAAILGRAGALLTSFDAKPDHVLIAAIDLRGSYREPNAFWDASTQSAPERLRADLELLPALAESGLCAAAKDISMGGVLGSTLMLLECSRVGATIDLESIPRPDGVALERWLLTFPSFGFVLSVQSVDAPRVLARFRARDLAAAVIGTVDDTRLLRLRHNAEEIELWNLKESSFIGARTTAVPS